MARGESYRGTEDEFVRIERDVPGFAGLFADSAGIITLRLKDPSRRDAAVSAVRALSGRFHLPSQLADALDGRTPLRVLSAQYSMSELMSLLRVAAQASLGLTVIALDADERSNQIVVYVESSADSSRLLERFAEAGMPPSDVRFVIGPRPVALQSSLRGRHRPTASGLQIRNQGGARCTLGWNVTTAFWNETGFLTAAHCASGSAGSGSAQLGQPMYQPSVLTADLVGTISLNPAFDQTDPMCLGSSYCTIADVMFVTSSNPTETWAKRVAKRPAFTRTTLWGPSGSVDFGLHFPSLLSPTLAYRLTRSVVPPVGRVANWKPRVRILS